MAENEKKITEEDPKVETAELQETELDDVSGGAYECAAGMCSQG